MKRSSLLCWTLSLVASLSLCAGDASAVPKSQRIEEWGGNANVANRANLAARAFNEGKFPAAVNGYKGLVGLNPNEQDFYLGLYLSAAKSGSWSQAAMALDELFDRAPELKTKLAKDYAEALRQADRGDEAKDVDKIIKKGGSDPTFIENRVKALVDKSIFDEEKVVEVKIEPVKRKELDASKVHADTSAFGLNLLNAFNLSESITICEYTGFEHEGDISFFRPPMAKFHIVEYLKGPPLNKSLPVRYWFDDKVGEEKPKDWKFDPVTMMPKKGSKWIIFIPNAVPVQGMHETYHGRFGRQEATDENMDKILKIIEQHKGQAR